MRELNKLLKKWDITKDISDFTNEEICEFLVFQKLVADKLEILSPIFRNEFLERKIGEYINSESGLQITTQKQASTSEIDVESIFMELDTNEFLSMINVVKSKAVSERQKKVLEKHTRVVDGESDIVKVSRITKKNAVLK